MESKWKWVKLIKSIFFDNFGGLCFCIYDLNLKNWNNFN